MFSREEEVKDSPPVGLGKHFERRRHRWLYICRDICLSSNISRS
jgi:hypothetical protein